MDEKPQDKLTDVLKTLNRDKRVRKIILNVINPEIPVPNDTHKVQTVLQAGVPAVYLTHSEVTEAQQRDSSLRKKRS